MHKLAFGQAGMGERGGTISAEGGKYPLADYVIMGDKICRGTKSAPTRGLRKTRGNLKLS